MPQTLGDWLKLDDRLFWPDGRRKDPRAQMIRVDISETGYLLDLIYSYRGGSAYTPTVSEVASMLETIATRLRRGELRTEFRATER